jgi:hypothetical protein
MRAASHDSQDSCARYLAALRERYELLTLRRDSEMGEAADEVLAESLSLEEGIEDE